jgi:hypothetical protein
MPMLEPKRHDARPRRSAAGRALALAAIVVLPTVLFAGWLDRLPGLAQKTGPRLTAAGADGLARAAEHVRALPPGKETVALAAQATQEGHWRFVNRAGETFTAGTPNEMKRAVSVLHPEAKAGSHLAVYVADDTILDHRDALEKLPAGAGLFVVAGRESYRVLHRGEGKAARYFAEIRPHLVVEIHDRRLFREAVWQLARPLEKANVRVLALEPGGPPVLSVRPRIDRATARALVDVVDPARLPAAMGPLRGQTLLVTGRIDSELLYVQPAKGPERSVRLKDLFKASEEADVNLIVLHASATPRQPGGRNWLWLTVEVKGLEQALQRARMADFLNALGAPNRRLAAIAMPVGRRALLDLAPADDLPGTGAARPVSDFFSSLASSITGNVVTAAVQANLRSAERQQELDRRLVPGIPSSAQVVYLALFIVGLFGVPLSRAWWQRVWPREDAAEYAGRTGYWAARAVRALAYALVFMPLTAVAAGPLNLFVQVSDGVMAPVRWWRRLRGSKPAREAEGARTASDGHPGPTSLAGARDLQVLEAAQRLGSTRPSR